MLPQDQRSAFTEVSALVRFQDADYIVLVADIATVETRNLRALQGEISDQEDALRRALDRLFTGF